MAETIQTIAAVLVVAAYFQGAVATFAMLGKLGKELQDAGRPAPFFTSKWHRADLSLYWPVVLIALAGAK